MFSKALFKQSCKANGVMWSIITFAVCFMLACVMLISGGGNIGKVKNSVEDTIIVGEIDAALEERSISYYKVADEGLQFVDQSYVANYKSVKKYAQDLDNMVNTNSYEDVMSNIQTGNYEQAQDYVGQAYFGVFYKWLSAKPQEDAFSLPEEYNQAEAAWNSQNPNNTAVLSACSYQVATNEKLIAQHEYQLASKTNPDLDIQGNEVKELVGIVLYTLNVNGAYDEFYLSHNEDAMPSYDTSYLLTNIDQENVCSMDERNDFRREKAQTGASIFLAGNMTNEANVDLMLEQLSKYGVTEEKYESFGYTYDSIKHTAFTTIISYDNRYDYEMNLLEERNANGEFSTPEEYAAAVAEMDKNLTGDLSNSLLSSLPAEVSSAIEEVGQMDLYGLIVGSIFFKMAGLLLPIIYMIMASNNLIAAQVDSGSMAYVLSTSTKRKQVTFTQALYLIGSLALMFVCTSITSVICLAIIDTADISLTYGELLLLNLGAFITLFAMSGICFFASCWFDRSKRSMSIGGGLSMFFLVATMLGLFGSKVIPSIVRLDALNNFNYVSIISLFDVTSILAGTTTFIWKLVILCAIGLAGYIVGSIKFDKKDLPL